MSLVNRLKNSIDKESCRTNMESMTNFWVQFEGFYNEFVIFILNPYKDT